MRTLLCLFILVFPLLPGSAASTENYDRFVDGKYVRQVIELYEGVRINPECARTAKICQALKGHRLPVKNKAVREKGISGHPANDYCVGVGGKPVLLLDAEKNQRNFCEFQDRSLIDSWHLLKRAGASP